MKRWLKDNSLSLVMGILFLIFLSGHSLTGQRLYNEEQLEHGQQKVTYSEYIGSSDFIESVFENWESEFLQMGAYVALTVFLYQKGSAESKKLIGREAVDQKPKKSSNKYAPWPVRKGGVVLKIYENSLLISFILLFLMSFFLHAYGGAQATTEEYIAHGEDRVVSTAEYMTTSKFWFESFQNWQSEFLAVFSIVVLSIWLRQKGSPESKPVNSAYSETGSS
ncbi:hypothetical protein H0V99_00280 [Candidatus Saccharibacteria bacterium]|nr:hypothetical protein [Candidatus Saccharibacteria bacterium]